MSGHTKTASVYIMTGNVYIMPDQPRPCSDNVLNSSPCLSYVMYCVLYKLTVTADKN